MLSRRIEFVSTSIVYSHFTLHTPPPLAGLPDLKSIVINLATFVLFVLPFCVFFDYERVQFYVGGLVASFAIALLVPPMGWWRPHPYSDHEHNRGKAPRN